MPETNSSHTASRDASKAGADVFDGRLLAPPPASRGADELGELARAWASSRPRAEVSRVLRLRLLLTVAFALVAALIMTLTHRDFVFALSSSPERFSDLRTRWLAGERSFPLVDNTYIGVEGLMPTRAHTLRFVDDSKGGEAARNVYFCPLSHILVITEAEVPAPLQTTATVKGFESLVAEGRASPGELPLTITASGRLFYGYHAPDEFLPIVGTFARLTGSAPSSMWLLVDRQTPSQSYWAIGVWTFAVLLVITALIFLRRAFRAWRDFHRSARDAA